MKKLKLFNKGWPCLCLALTCCLLSCSIQQYNVVENITVLKYRLTVDVLPEVGQQQLMEVLNNVHIKDLNSEFLQIINHGQVQRFTIYIVADDLFAFEVFRNRLSTSGLMVTSLTKEPQL